jgi:hypothetical protein
MRTDINVAAGCARRWHRVQFSREISRCQYHQRALDEMQLIVTYREICTRSPTVHWRHTMHILRCISRCTQGAEPELIVKSLISAPVHRGGAAPGSDGCLVREEEPTPPRSHLCAVMRVLHVRRVVPAAPIESCELLKLLLIALVIALVIALLSVGAAGPNGSSVPAPVPY